MTDIIQFHPSKHYLCKCNITRRHQATALGRWERPCSPIHNVISRGRKLLATTGAEPRSRWEQQLFSKYLWRIYRVRLGCNNSDRHLISPVGFLFSASKSTTGPNANCGEETNPRLVNGDTKPALGLNPRQQVRSGIKEEQEKKKNSC